MSDGEIQQSEEQNKKELARKQRRAKSKATGRTERKMEAASSCLETGMESPLQTALRCRCGLNCTSSVSLCSYSEVTQSVSLLVETRGLSHHCHIGSSRNFHRLQGYKQESDSNWLAQCRWPRTGAHCWSDGAIY